LQCYFLPFLLKSDHFGIEIDPTFAVNTLEAKLKSDHFGIEINGNSWLKLCLLITKIRPFWD